MEDVDQMIAEIQERLPAASAYAYIAIWAFAEMMQRASANPETPGFADILFPHTRIPLFSQEEATKLEEAWRTYMTPANSQQGGANFPIPIPPTKEDLMGLAKTAGEGLASVSMDPETFSVDRHYEGFTKTLDDLDEKLTNFSKQYGLVALESTAPDPKLVIPPIPFPIIFPIRLAMPILNTLLEVLRIGTTFLPGPLQVLGKPVTFLMVLLDLARGNLYHAIFSFLGIFGQYPMYFGILLKILRDAYVLIAPDIRDDARDVLWRSGKSFLAGFTIWLFALVSPDMVRKPVVRVLDKIREFVDAYNQSVEVQQIQAQAALAGKGSLEIPKIPSTRIPTIGDLYIIQEYLHHPQIYCHDEVAPLIAEMRAIPPLALFFDLIDIPAIGSERFTEACASIASAPLGKAFAPRLTMVDAATGKEVGLQKPPAAPGTDLAIAV
jgi:hypothetical protein